MPRGREEIPWPQTAAVLTLERLCERSSELHIEDTWYRGRASDALLGILPQRDHTNRLYGGLHQPVPHKAKLDRYLRQRLGDVFDQKYGLLPYHITRTCNEGQHTANPLARRVYSRNSRSA